MSCGHIRFFIKQHGSASALLFGRSSGLPDSRRSRAGISSASSAGASVRSIWFSSPQKVTRKRRQVSTICSLPCSIREKVPAPRFCPQTIPEPNFREYAVENGFRYKALCLTGVCLEALAQRSRDCPPADRKRARWLRRQRPHGTQPVSSAGLKRNQREGHIISPVLVKAPPVNFASDGAISMRNCTSRDKKGQ